MELDFTGKKVVVTGAASGIGRGMALGFAREGATVVASDRNEENLQRLQKELELEGLPVIIQVCDVSDEQEVAVLFGLDVLNKGLDVLVHCAGFTYFKHFTQTTTEEFRRLIDVNLSGTYYCLQASVRKMKENEVKGSNIIISSINAQRLLPSQAITPARKQPSNRCRNLWQLK